MQLSSKKKKKLLWASVVLQQQKQGFSLAWNHVFAGTFDRDVMKCSIYSSVNGVMSLLTETENRAHVCVCVISVMYDLTLKSCSRLDK